MHRELSYLGEVPATLVITCLRAPEEGGATAVADASGVLQDLPADLVARIERDGWILERNHNEYVGVPLEQAFGSADRAVIERYAAHNAVDLTWSDGALHTRSAGPAWSGIR
ncbi:TauD/TfdA family dioxygenase [Nonomuraea cypriaca]|uniref:TauD/TfdA family dioxygenase n=1 Tax=Nonomuraea cypriaca TaxID=1187855 RepID=UPI001A9C8CF4|nr:TauD/TfdA family dioxygenase [Nonomuraea cypriaca]